MKSLPRVIIIVVVLMGLVSLGFWLKGGDANPGKSEKDGDPTVAAERRDIDSTLLLTGEVRALLSVEVKPEVGGRIKDLNVAVGDKVKKGAVLATIDDRDLQTERSTALTQIEGARLAVQKTEGNYNRAKALFEQKLISKEVFSNLESDFAIAQNALEQAKRRLQTVDDKLVKTSILAPFDGTVLDIPQNINEGQVVSAAASVTSGTIVMTFSNLDQLLIVSQVNQMDAPRLKEDQAIEISTTEGEARGVRAHIQMVSPLAKVKNNVKGFEVKVIIDDNDGRLKPGMSVSMYVPIGRADNAVSVPITAIFRDDDESIVYVRKDDQVEKRSVKVGITDMAFAEITSGLQEGERILLIEPADPHSKS